MEANRFVEGTGTYFVITGNKYFNITLKSSKTVHVFLESAPRMVSFIIESNNSVNSTLLTLSGFEPNVAYYRYQDGYLMENFTADSTGQYPYTQDIFQGHHVVIQEEISTLYISSDYTFTGDINETIVVTADNIVIDGTYIIEYYSVDIAGNEETVKSATAILVSFKVNSYLTDSDFNPITYFDVVFAKDKSGGYKLVATNPGQFYYLIEVINNWPIIIDSLIINASIPGDFVLKGAVPIHVYLDDVDITDLCTIDGTMIIVTNVPSRSVVYATIHLDYGLKGTVYASLDDFEMKGYICSVIVSGFSGSPSMSGEGLIGIYSSSATLIACKKKTTAIAGFVADVNGNPIVGITVRLFDSNGNLVTETVTDENGFYYFVDIEAGDYTVKVTYNGQTYTQETTVAENELAQVDFKIE